MAKDDSRSKFMDALENGDNRSSAIVPDITQAFGLKLPTRKNGIAPFRTDENGHTHIGHFVLSDVGIVQVLEGLDEDEWLTMFRHTEQVNRAIQWIIADLALYGADFWGKKYDELADLTGYSVTTINDMAYVARQVNLSVRTDKLTFSHHKLLAPYSEDDQRKLIQAAIDLNLTSVDKFQYYLKHGKPPALPGEAGKFEMFLIKSRLKYRNFTRKSKQLQAHEKAQVRQLIDDQIEELRKLRDEL